MKRRKRSTSKHSAGSKYSDKGFWDKLSDYALAAGREIVEKALWLYYVLEKEQVPAWAKSVIVGALGYFIWPLDAVPDPIPVVGYTDDLGALAAAVATVAMYIDRSVKAKATRKLKEWFG